MTNPALPEKAQQILDGTAPERFRDGVAAGAVPLPPVEFVSCLAVLIAKDPERREQALATLRGLPATIIGNALEAPLAAPVFRVIYKTLELDRADRQRLVLNAATPDDVIAALARTEHDTTILDILVRNHERMLRSVEIAEALLENTAIGPASKAGLEEFFARAYAGKVMLQQGLASREELAAEGDWDADLLDAISAAAAHRSADDDAPLPEELLAGDDSEEEDEDVIRERIEMAATVSGEADAITETHKHDRSAEERITNLRRALVKMTVPQKIKLAVTGGKEARSLLIFDGNKVVSSLVLKNPRISDKEVIAIASSKSVRQDLLRAVARDRRFIKNYAIKKALVENAKTPQDIAMNLLTQMRDADLKNIARSRSVSNNVATQAKRMLQRKAQKKEH